RVLPVGGDGAAMPPGKLFLPSVAVVDGDDDSAVHCGRDPGHVALRDQGSFDSLCGVGMDAVAVQELQGLGGWRMPGFTKSSTLLGNMQLALRAEHFNRQRVEEFVGENDDRNFRD